MSSFDFLASARVWHVPATLRVPKRFHSVLVGLGAVAAFACASEILESARLNAAWKAEASYRRAFNLSAEAARNVHVYARRVQQLADQDAALTRAAFSGARSVRVVGSIARVLPANVWLDRLSMGSGALDLQARAGTLQAASEALHGLSALDGLSDLRLLSVTRIGGRSRSIYAVSIRAAMQKQ